MQQAGYVLTGYSTEFETTVDFWVLQCYDTPQGIVGRLTDSDGETVYLFFNEECSEDGLNGFLSLDKENKKMRYMANGITKEISLQPPVNLDNGVRVDLPGDSGGIRGLPAHQWRGRRGTQRLSSTSYGVPPRVGLSVSGRTRRTFGVPHTPY
ncbi:uncharacterized protein LOC128995059 [Macrosteles quadrilineatus]|uniref:uncharacterized protein LOC128995059 n=1 Tax=Macrosteles quadrilineatus TaxID=74068 RepID=UPI0023E1DC62|nr:uncharacterized protein LOC128995059 [Macrosteles quadrilineatus]